MFDFCFFGLYNPFHAELILSDLKASGAVPHYFGLGFIQLKLDQTRRLHFWAEDWPKVDTENEIHNHRYDFKSVVLAGTVLQDIFHVPAFFEKRQNESDLLALAVSCKPDSPDDGRVLGYATPRHSMFLETRAGGTYQLTTTDYHRAWSEDVTITELMRGPILLDEATVLQNEIKERVCPFSVAKSTDECWDKIASMLEQLEFLRK